MRVEPKLPLYSEALCVAGGADVSAIIGKRVSILDRTLNDSDEWMYTVSPGKTAPTYFCLESSLVPVDPIPLISDEELMRDIVDQTANLRHSVRWSGVRQLIHDRGFDPLRCFLLSCDQGSDVNITLVLPDGSVVNTDFREDPETRQATSFDDWEPEAYADREIKLCLGILAGDTTMFDVHVRNYFEEHMAATDGPLPSKTACESIQRSILQRRSES